MKSMILDAGLIRNLEIHKVGAQYRASLVDDEKYILVNGYGLDQNEALNDLFRNMI